MSSPHHLILGAGPVGRAVAAELLARGERVVLTARSARPSPCGIPVIALDAADAAAVTAAAQDAYAIVNCLNPPDYHRWPGQWPPMHAAALAAAETTGAVLVTTSNLYPYGETSAPITAQTPQQPAGAKGRVRAAMWQQTRQAIEAGRLHGVEVRSADYLGTGTYTSISPALARARDGKSAWVLGRHDQPHSYAYVPDVARTLVAAALTPSAWDRIWITPSAPARTQAEVARAVACQCGHGSIAVRSIPEPMLQIAGLIVPLLREQRELASQRLGPFTVDGSETTGVLGIEATGWESIIAEVARG